MCFFLGALNNLLLHDQCVSPSCNISSLLADVSNSLLKVICSPMGTHVSSYTINSMKGSSCLGVHFGAVLQAVLCWAGLRCAAWSSGTRVLGLQATVVPGQLIPLTYLLDGTIWGGKSLLVGCLVAILSQTSNPANVGRTHHSEYQ